MKVGKVEKYYQKFQNSEFEVKVNLKNSNTYKMIPVAAL
jgi:hypothetical protein